MLLGDVLAQNNLAAPVAATPICGLTYDSRRVEPGFLFAAWQGARADGHTFVPQALQRGAAAIVCERALDCGAVPCVVVPDVRRTLARAAQTFYGDPAQALTMVGITGTNGKTTTAHMVEAILAAAGLSPGVIGTLGARFAGQDHVGTLTTPESVDLVALLAAMRTANCQSVAMEVSSQALAQQRVAGVAFDVGVFTNLTHDHLDYHGTLEAYFAAKARLFADCMKPTGTAVLNADDTWANSIHAPRALRFSTNPQGRADIRLLQSTLGPQGIRMEVKTPRGVLEVVSPLLGRFNVENILAAIGVGEALAISHAHIARGLGALLRVPGRLERVSHAHEPLVLVDYAHTPDALDKALGAVREVTGGRLFCVFGCGGDRDPRKRAPMGQAAGRGADWAILTNDNPRGEAPERIAAAVEEGLKAAACVRSQAPVSRGYWIELDRRAAIFLAVRAASPQDAVLIAGKGHETYQIIGSTHHQFDDRRQARLALDARGDGHA